MVRTVFASTLRTASTSWSGRSRVVMRTDTIGVSADTSSAVACVVSSPSCGCEYGPILTLPMLRDPSIPHDEIVLVAPGHPRLWMLTQKRLSRRVQPSRQILDLGTAWKVWIGIQRRPNRNHRLPAPLIGSFEYKRLTAACGQPRRAIEAIHRAAHKSNARQCGCSHDILRGRIEGEQRELPGAQPRQQRFPRHG